MFIYISAGNMRIHSPHRGMRRLAVISVCCINTSSTASEVDRNDTPVVDLVNYKSRRSPVETLCVSTRGRRLVTSYTACGVRHCPQGNLLRQRVVDFVNYGSSLYSELQGGCGRWRFLSIISYFLSIIFCFLREDNY